MTDEAAQHGSGKNLHRYVAEVDFRYSNHLKLGVEDKARTNTTLRGIISTRLTYRDSSVVAG